MTKKRRNFTAEQKVAFIRKHLVEQIPISDICEQNGIHLNLFYKWQQEFFENGAKAFEKDNSKKQKIADKKVNDLEGKVNKKDNVIAELVEENLRLKKQHGLI
jgi:transposase